MISTFDQISANRVSQASRATSGEHLVPYAQVVELLGEVFMGEWDSAVNYAKGKAVMHEGSFYIANSANVNKVPASHPVEWRLAASKGTSSHVYVRYATDTSGTGFSTSPTGKTHLAILVTSTAIVTPVADDFAGWWVSFVGGKGDPGDPGDEGDPGDDGDSSYTYIAYASDASGTGFSLTPGSGLNFVAFKTTTSPIAVPAAGDFTGLWRQYAVAGLSATGPLTFNAGTGVLALNAASAATPSYVVQRDASGDFATRKIALTSSEAPDHLTFGSAALGYSSGNVVLNQPFKPSKTVVGTTHEVRPGSGKLEIYSIADTANALEVTGTTVKVVTTLQVASLSGVLKAATGTVSGSATTDDLTEGATNLYFTNARADTRADGRIAAVAGQANGLAQLGADSKLAPAQIPSALLGATVYQGTWNANTNSPALASSTGTKGHYYIVTTAGTTNLDGLNSWAVGDWAIFNGTTWDKVDNTDAVISVNGLLGTVVLTTDHIGEGSTNLYFTAARGLGTALTGFSATTGAITAADTVLTAFNKTQGRLAAIEAWTTTSLPEGSNLYYTDARVLTRASTGLGRTLVAPTAGTSGSPDLFTVTGPAHTTLAASAEATDLYFNLRRIVEFSTGALTTQRAVRITAPQYAFVGVSTVTDASTIEIGGAPEAWTNATITNAAALRIAAGAVSGGNTNAFGLHVSAPTGAVNNFAAVFAGGNVGIGTTAPTKLLDVNGDTVRVRTARTPASATATGAVGEICWDADYVYVCTATNAWKRAALTTWP